MKNVLNKIYYAFYKFALWTGSFRLVKTSSPYGCWYDVVNCIIANSEVGAILLIASIPAWLSYRNLDMVFLLIFFGFSIFLVHKIVAKHIWDGPDLELQKRYEEGQEEVSMSKWMTIGVLVLLVSVLCTALGAASFLYGLLHMATT